VWPAGPRRLEWDGRDDAGERLPRGLYFARVRDAGASASLRLFLR
jgi:flagellar hook assembly protein FlgD